MKRPVWGAAPNFSIAWSALEEVAAHPPSLAARKASKQVLKALSAARVIAVGAEQVEQLPKTPGIEAGWSALAPWMNGVRPPFDVVFLDLGGARLSQWTPEANARVLGAVVGRVRTADRGTLVAYQPLMSIRREPPFMSRVSVIADGRKLKAFYYDTLTTANARAADDAAAAVERAVAVLSFLESANVGLEEAQMHPIAAKRLAKKNGRVALTVRVRQRKTKPRSGDGKRTFSHRFEVAGHYMHFPEGTKLADSDPTKLSFVPGRGFVLRQGLGQHRSSVLGMSGIDGLDRTPHGGVAAFARPLHLSLLALEPCQLSLHEELAVSQPIELCIGGHRGQATGVHL